ncbi:MAG: hypothetical protein ACRD9S_20685 [Pyrinomonadaceae bacterium]
MFDCTAASFGKPDRVNFVIHNYRRRLSLAAGAAQTIPAVAPFEANKKLD